MLAWAVVVAFVLVWNIQLRRRVRARTLELQTKQDQLMREMRERQRIEETLRLTQFSIDHSSYAVYWIGADARFLFVNNTACRCLGYTREELLTLTVHDIDPDLPRSDWEPRRRACQERSFSTFEARHRAKDGRIFPVEITSNYLRFNGTDYLCAFARDITEREKMEQALRTGEERYRLLFERNLAGVYRSTLSGRFLECNDAFARIYGYESAQDLMATSAWDMYFTQQDRQSYLDRLRQQRYLTNLEVCCRRKDGTPVWLLENVGMVFEEGAEPIIEGTVVDITERRSAVEALRQSENQYRDLVESSNDLIWSVDAAGRCTFLNRRATKRIFGYEPEEMLGRPFSEFQPADAARRDLESYARARPGEAYHQYETRLLRRDGTEVHLSFSGLVLGDEHGNVTGSKGIATDISERKRLEAQLLQAQKMEAIGKLAGGVAHDFNNLLTVVTGYASLLLGSLPAEDSSRPFIDEIRKAGDRAADLTRQLLAFSRKQILSPVVLDLNSAVANMYKMLHRLIGEDIELMMQHDPLLNQVKADQTQITQVLMNLAVNARDAMPHGGALTVATKNVDLEQRLTRGQEIIPAGKYVMLTMTDTGTGMDEHTKAHLFEPFFTTKDIGQGTGLGLATAYGIIRQSGGFIEVESTLGHGSTFKVYLPAWEGAGVVEAPPAVQTDGPRGTETVLVVEDDANVRSMICQVLSRSGYRVLESANGQAGVEMCAEHAATIDLVVTDMVLPGLSGQELRELVRLERPQLKFLFMTGYTDDARLPNGSGDNGEKYLLLKPFTPGQLARRVRDLLDE
jgi:PAS domain S-box-containing protein